MARISPTVRYTVLGLIALYILKNPTSSAHQVTQLAGLVSNAGNSLALFVSSLGH